MSKTVIAIHSIVYVPEGGKKQETAAPGAKIKVSDADYEALIAAGAAKAPDKAVVAEDAEKAAAEKAAAEKAAAEKAAAEKAKAAKAGKPAVDDVVG